MAHVFMSVPSLNGFLRLSSDWVFGSKPEAGDVERGCEEDQVRLDEERAGLLPGFTELHHHTASGLHYITSL